jgi:hypothetical protein
MFAAELTGLLRCPICYALVDRSRPNRALEYAEVKRRFRANLRWAEYLDEEIEASIAEVERSFDTNAERMLRLWGACQRAVRRSRRGQRQSVHNLPASSQSTGMPVIDFVGEGVFAAGNAVMLPTAYLGKTLLTHALSSLRAVPMFRSLTDEEEALTMKRLRWSWRKGTWGWKKQDVDACGKCGARFRSAENKFCEDCGG